MKTKWRSTCERYSKIHVPYKYKTIIEGLSKNQSICVMKQDKGRGVAVMDRSKYTEKCLSIHQISSQSLPILLNSFSFGTEKIMYFSVFSPKQVNCPSNSSASSNMIK